MEFVAAILIPSLDSFGRMRHQKNNQLLAGPPCGLSKPTRLFHGRIGARPAVPIYGGLRKVPKTMGYRGSRCARRAGPRSLSPLVAARARMGSPGNSAVTRRSVSIRRVRSVRPTFKFRREPAPFRNADIARIARPSLTHRPNKHHMLHNGRAARGKKLKFSQSLARLVLRQIR